MRVKVFADTNIVFYSREDTRDPRALIAQTWLFECATKQRLCVNLQVLNELANVLFKKQKHLTNEQVFKEIDKLAVMGSEPVTIHTVLSARAIHSNSSYSWWDCLLLASALELRCSHFLSEDLQDGQKIGDLIIINPFLHVPEEILPA